jgi:hypothetical protein
MGVPPTTASQTSPAPAATPPAPAQKPPASKAKGALEDPPVTNAAPVPKDNKSAGPATLSGNPETFPASDFGSAPARVSLAATAATAAVVPGAFIVGPSLLAQAAAPPAAAQKPTPVSAWLSLAGDLAGVPAFSRASTLHVGHGPTVEDALRQIQNPTSVDTLTHNFETLVHESWDVGEPPKPKR